MDKKWFTKLPSIMKRGDLGFKEWLEKEIPGKSNQERERRLLEELIDGKKQKR